MFEAHAPRLTTYYQLRSLYEYFKDEVVLNEIHARGYTNTIPTPAECVDADDKRLLRLWIEKLGLDELGVQDTLNYALSCQPLGHVKCIEMLVKEFRANPGKLVDDLLTYDLTEELEELFDMLDLTFPPELIVEQFKRYYPTLRWICWKRCTRS